MVFPSFVLIAVFAPKAYFDGFSPYYYNTYFWQMQMFFDCFL